MTREDIFEVVKQQIQAVMFALPMEKVTIEKSLKDLGANSVDRMEIVVMSMEKLGIEAPLVELGNIKNLQELVEYLHGKKNNG